jgi:hypothetical protein
MRRLLYTLVVAALATIPMTARAQCRGSAGSSDYKCTNGCPLAKTASTRRAFGDEAALASASLRKVVTETVVTNLDRI